MSAVTGKFKYVVAEIVFALSPFVKLVAPLTVPPVKVPPPPVGICQLALPLASDVKTYPLVAPEVICNVVVFVFPLTSNFSDGDVVPIPTVPAK
mgnify:CR=1 FL=1